MRKPGILVLLLSVIFLLAWPAPSFAAVSVDRAEMSGGDLRLEGDNARANARILVDGVDRGAADGRGDFRIEVSGFTTSTCRISVNDGTGAVTVSVDGCTPTSTPPPEPEPTPEPTPDPTPTPPPPAPATVSDVTLSPSTATAGVNVGAKVTLSAPAPSSGALVTLTSSDTSVATVSSLLNIAAGTTSATANVSTKQVTSTSSATITASFGGTSRSAVLTVNPLPPPPPPTGLALSTFTVTPQTMHPGDTAQGVVTLNGPAPAGGATVSLFNSQTGIVRCPPSVLVPEGATSASFTVTAFNASTATATITANFGGVARSVTMSVTPAETGQTLDSVSISPTSVMGSQTADGRVSFTGQVAADTTVTLSSSDTTLATVPATVTVPTGSAFVHFPVTTKSVTAPASVTITASAGGLERSATLSLTPPPANGASVASVTFAPSTLEGGNASTGTVTLNAPSVDGDIVSLVSSRPDLVQVPSTVILPSGTTAKAFGITTAIANADVDVTITATPNCCGGAGAGSAVLHVTQTTTPPQSDTVNIERLQWRRCVLSVEATGSDPDAILTLNFASTGGVVFTLTNEGGGQWSGSRALRPPGTNVPVTFQLRSNLGGIDTATVSDSRAGACKADL